MIKTIWSDNVDTTAYPRPQMVRGSYENLDGEWDFKIVSGEYSPKANDSYDGKIRVPFALESPLSGVGRHLKADETLVMRRTNKTSSCSSSATRPNTESARAANSANGVAEFGTLPNRECGRACGSNMSPTPMSRA